MIALERVFTETMPSGMGYDYLGMSFQEKQAQQGLPPAAIFGFSLLFVFLILAALYESPSLPFSVLLSTPIAVFGAFGMLYLRRVITGAFVSPYLVQIENNVFAQIGLESLKGKSCCRQVKFYSGVCALAAWRFCLSRILKAGPGPWSYHI